MSPEISQPGFSKIFSIISSTIYRHHSFPNKVQFLHFHLAICQRVLKPQWIHISLLRCTVFVWRHIAGARQLNLHISKTLQPREGINRPKLRMPMGTFTNYVKHLGMGVNEILNKIIEKIPIKMLKKERGSKIGWCNLLTFPKKIFRVLRALDNLMV